MTSLNVNETSATKEPKEFDDEGVDIIKVGNGDTVAL